MSEPDYTPQPSWIRKFRDAYRGIAAGTRDSSFQVQVAMAILVVIAGGVLRVTWIEWCLLALSIAVVVGAELFNTALEELGKAIDRKFNPHLEAALNMSSGAVLLVALGAAVVGILVFGFRLGILLDWWR